MVRLDLLVFGYRILHPDGGKERTRMMVALMHKGVSATARGELDVLLRERDYLQNKDFIAGQNCKVESAPRGLFPCVRSFFKQRFSLFALLFVIVLNLIAPSVIWEVRVSGCESLDAAYVEDALSSLGVSVGTPWRRLDLSRIETALLSAHPAVGWVSINRQGSVAYVSVKEAERPPEVTPELGYSDVVAASDCVISEISVTSGYAAVEVGQTVKRGDVLISGLPPPGSEGEPCHASGEVLGRVDLTLTVSVEAEISERSYGDGKINALGLEILNFSVNIFKIYRNSSSECVIIENNEKCRLFGIYELPISVMREYAVPYSESVRRLDSSELVHKAAEKMREQVLERTREAELVRAQSSGGFTDTGYEMTTAITVIERVGCDRTIAVE